MTRRVLCIIALVGIGGARFAAASDALGLYAGGAVGHGDVRLDGSYTATANEFDHGHVGWKALLGARPIPLVGAEIEYLDFGDIRYDGGSGGPQVMGRVKARAVALMGLGYVPLPMPFLDVYGKLGGARTGETVNASIAGLACPVNNSLCGVVRHNLWQTSVAFGAGVQFKLAAFAVRAEYERIAASHGQPDMLSLGATYRFQAL